MNAIADNVTMLPASPVTISESAYADLLSLCQHNKLRYGDMKKAINKYGLTKKQYSNLRVRLSRERHGIVTQISARAGKQKPLENFNAHGRLYYQTLVLSDAHINKFPKKAKNNGWQGYVSEPFTIMAYRDGKVMVFPKSPDWRTACSNYLSTIWDSQAVSSFMNCLQVNGSKLELAVTIPGVPSGQHYEDKSGLVSIDTDHTPKDSGNVEIKVNIGSFEQKLSEMNGMVAKLYSGFEKYMGGVTVLSLLQNMDFKISQLQNEIERIKSPPIQAQPAHLLPSTVATSVTNASLGASADVCGTGETFSKGFIQNPGSNPGNGADDGMKVNGGMVSVSMPEDLATDAPNPFTGGKSVHGDRKTDTNVQSMLSIPVEYSIERTEPPTESHRCPRLLENYIDGKLEYFCPARKESLWKQYGGPVYKNFICLTQPEGCLYMELRI